VKTNLFLQYITGGSEFLPLELIPPKNMSVKECMDIYLNAYFARLTEVLREHFCACKKIVGEESFMDICAEYILNHPSCEWNINRYGKSFPSMISSNFVAEDFPYIADLATLEWSKQILFHKKDDIGLTPEEVQKIGMTENSKLKLVSSIEIGTSVYNIPAIFTSTFDDDESQFPQNWEEPTSWIMYKNDYQVYLHTISMGESMLIRNLLNGNPLSEALKQYEANCEDADKKDEVVKDLFQWLSTNRLIQKIY
jgi:hypothetical protein